MDPFRGREAVDEVVVAETPQDRPPIPSLARVETVQLPVQNSVKNETNLYLVLTAVVDCLWKYVAALQGLGNLVDQTSHAQSSSVFLVQCTCRDAAIILAYHGLQVV